jgi:TolB-like protein
MSLPALLLLSGLSAAAPAPRTVAIAYFENDSGQPELDPLRKGLADMLITDLAGIGSLQIVEREKLNAVLAELKLGASKFIDPKTAQRLGRGLAAEYIMTGSYLVQGEAMRIDARVVQVATGKVAATEKVDGRKDDFFSLEKDLVDALVRTLEIKLTAAERGKLRANATQSWAAWARYSAGLDARDRGDEAEARRQFQAALDADPNYRAARTATERLKAIFDRTAQQHDAATGEMLRGLDPKAPDFGQKLNDVLAELNDRSDEKQMGRKVALLTWVAENDYLQTGAMGFTRVVSESLALALQYLQDPDEWDRIPMVCEYLITRYPKDPMAQAQCRVYLKAIDATRSAYAKFGDKGTKMARDSWAQGRENALQDWDKVMVRLDSRVRNLFAVYVRKLARP